MTTPSFNALMLPFGQPRLGNDIFHRNAVVSLAVHHHVTIQGIQMAVSHAMVRARILIRVGGACRSDGAESALEDVRRIHQAFSSNDIVGQ